VRVNLVRTTDNRIWFQRVYLLGTILACVVNLCTCIYTIEGSVKMVKKILLTELYNPRVPELPSCLLKPTT